MKRVDFNSLLLLRKGFGGLVLWFQMATITLLVLSACTDGAVPEAGKVPGEELIQVPLKWCAVYGTTAVLDPGAVGETSTDNVLWRRHERASDNIWIPGAKITLRSALIADVTSQASFPIIPDPLPPSQGGPGVLGDIEETYFGGELQDVIADCEQAWDDLELSLNANIEGIITVNIGRFVASSGIQFPTQGIASSAFICNPFASRTSTICQDPASMPANVGAYIVVRDNVNSLAFSPHENTLAHEVGHTLFLGHGNGLDDDSDNLFDECCDADEDINALPQSLMSPSGGSDVITALQKDLARYAALVTPGSVIDPALAYEPGDVISDQRVDTRHEVEKPELDIVWVGMTVNENQQVSIFSHKLLSSIPEGAHIHYLVFADLDGSPDSGGAPFDLAYSTEFEGAEVVTDVEVEVTSKEEPPQVKVRLWVAKDGEWVEQTAREVVGYVTTSVAMDAEVPLFDVVNVQLPTNLIGPASPHTRIQAMAIDVDGNGRDVLPDTSKGSSVPLFMVPPQYPECLVAPPQVKPGGDAVVEVRGLLPDELAEVFLGDELIAEAKIDSVGKANIPVKLPPETRAGVRLVTVGIAGTAVTADCAVEIADEFGAIQSPTILLTPPILATDAANGLPGE